MAIQFKVLKDVACWTAGHKARKIEHALNSHAEEGWEFVALDSVTVLGFDVGFYLVLKRET